jgi:hypothetical protein
VTVLRAALLRPGDWVAYDGGEHQVVALAGSSVRLRSDDGAESVVLAAYLTVLVGAFDPDSPCLRLRRTGQAPVRRSP